MADVTIEFKGDAAIRRQVERTINDFHGRMLNVMGEEAIDGLMSIGSEWPVDTGLSQASFDYNTQGGVVHITNDTDYAVYVEARTGAAVRQLRNDLPIIAQAADEWVQRQWEKLQ